MTPADEGTTTEAAEQETEASDEDEEDLYTLQIEYVYANGGRVENTYYELKESGSTFEISAPVKEGYTISCDKEGYFNAETGKISGTVTADLELTLTYSPKTVMYTVKHEFEQADGTKKEETETLTGLVGDLTRAVARTVAGYTAMSPVQQRLVGDGTVVEIQYFLNSYTFSYVSNGGNYIAQEHKKYGETVTIDATKTPSRTGYTFAGWYLNEDCTEVAPSSITVTQNMEVYAKWAEDTVEYTIAYWYENADDTDYSYYASETKTAVVGSQQTVSTAEPKDNYFTFEKADTVTVAGDGSTVLNVYFNRKTYTLTFQVKNQGWPTTYKTVATITAKYGAYIADKFNEAPFSTTYSGRAWKCTKTSQYRYALQTLDRMPGFDATFRLYDQSSNTKKTIHYYADAADGTENVLLKDVDTYFNYITYDEEYHEIAGFTRKSKTEAGFDTDGSKKFENNEVSLYYVRNSYNLTFVNEGQTDKTVSLKYEASISSAQYTPTRPNTLPEYYEFAGWYYDETFSKAVNWDSDTMPLDGAVVYAKWAPKSFTVTFNSDGGTEVPTQTVVGGELVAGFDDTTRDEYEFLGWYEDGSESPFDFKMPITRDVRLTAKWEKVTIIDYTVNYYKTGTTEQVFATEQLRGYVGQQVNIMSKTHETLIADHVSQTITLSWKAENNVITFYYSEPHDIYYKVQYIDAVTGKALKPEEVNTTRNTNAAASYIKIDGYEVNSTRQIITLDDEASEAAIKNNIITFYYKPIIEVAVKGNTGTYVYDGTEKTVSGSAATCQKVAGQATTEMPEGITIDLADGQAAQAQGTAAGTYNMGLSKDSFVAQFAESSSYTSENCVVRIVKVEDGWLKITPQSIDPPTDPDTDPEYKGVTVGQLEDEIYDGTEYKKVPAVKDKDGNPLVAGKDFEVSYTHSDDKDNFTDVQTITVTIKGIGNYKGEVTRTYEIKQREIKITAGSASKTYDGTALTKNSYDVTSETKIASTDSITSVTVEGSIINVGTVQNVASAAVIKRGEVDATGNYEITYLPGELEITKQTINPGKDPENPDPEYAGVTVNDPSNSVYDSTEHKFVPVVTTKEGTPLTADTDYSVVYKRNGEVTTDFINVGEITVEITGEGNYKGTVTKTYQITPAIVVVAADNKTKTYGDADPELTVQKTGLYGKDDVVYTISREKAGTAEGEKVGNYDITPTGEKSQGNYTVQYKSGVLTIAASGKLVVNGTDYTGTYDAQEHGSAATASVTEGTTISYKVEDGEWTTEFPTITDVGIVHVTVKAENPNYTTAEATYVLMVNPKPVTVKAEPKTKVYGTGDPELTVTKEGLLGSDDVAYNIGREDGEDVGTYTITPTGAKSQGNYYVTYENSTLTITAQKINPGPDPENPDPEYGGVKVNDPSNVTYDGNVHKWEPTVTDSEDNALVKGTDYEVTYDVENFIDVKTVTVTITGKGNYQGEVVKKYEITKRAIEITAGSASKTYDGTALTEDSYEVTSGSEAATDEITSVTVTGSITNVGTEENIASEAVIMRGEVDATGNYEITYLPGTLKVTAQKIDPGPDPENPDPEYSGVEINDPDDVTYDGEEHKFVPEVTDKDGNPLVEGEDYEVTYDVDNFTDVTKVTVTITGKGNYQGEVVKKYEITKRAIEITAASASKTYDGTALTKNSYDVTSETKIASTDSITSVTVTGSITNVGTVQNIASAAVIKRGDVDATGNYAITYLPGTLKVTAQKIDPGPDPENPDPEYSGVEINDPDDVTYDGEEHKFVPEVTDKDGNPLEEGKDYIVTYDTDNFTDVTKVTVIITGNGNYDGEIIKTYEIKPAKVTITTDSASKTYDGTALTAGGRIEGLVNGEEVSFKATGSQTSVGTSENTYSLVWDKTAKEGNYTIDKVTLGTLTVTQAPEPETPSQDGGNTNNRDHTAPRTGDDTMNTVLLLMLLMILAGAGLGTAAYAYKKRK